MTEFFPVTLSPGMIHDGFFAKRVTHTTICFGKPLVSRRGGAPAWVIRIMGKEYYVPDDRVTPGGLIRLPIPYAKLYPPYIRRRYDEHH